MQLDSPTNEQKKSSQVTTGQALRSTLWIVLGVIGGLFIWEFLWYHVFFQPKPGEVDLSFGLPMFISYIIVLAIVIPIVMLMRIKLKKR